MLTDNPDLATIATFIRRLQWAALALGALWIVWLLAPILRAHMGEGMVRGEHHRGRWTDVGTPQRLAQLDAELAAR